MAESQAEVYATPTELYYKSLADIYITEYEHKYKLSERILTAMGVIVSMRSELVSYSLKNGSNEKVKQQDDRLMLLDQIISDFSVISDRNFQLRDLLRKKGKEIGVLEAKVEELTNELNKQKEQWENLVNE